MDIETALDLVRDDTVMHELQMEAYEFLREHKEEVMEYLANEEEVEAV